MDRKSLEAAVNELMRDYHIVGNVDDRTKFTQAVLRAADLYAARCTVNALVAVAEIGEVAR